MNIEQIVEFRNELKNQELKDFKEVFPINKNDIKFINWIKLSEVSKQFSELSYKLKYSEIEKCYYLSWYIDGILDDFIVIEKNDIKKCNNRLFIKRHIVGEYLKNTELVK